jgi:tetratricopeptide (TPR) repeat protein
MAYAGRGVTYFQMDERDKARSDFQQALRLDWNLPWVHAALGDLCLKGGDYRNAVEHYGNTLALDRNQPAVYTNRAIAGVRLGDYGRAEEDFAEAVRLQGGGREPAEATLLFGRDAVPYGTPATLGPLELVDSSCRVDGTR